jgi:hypothetical protein
MGALAKEMDWVIISADTAITRNPHEVEAWKLAGHPIFFFKHSLLNRRFGSKHRGFATFFPILYAWQRAHARATVFRSVSEEGSRAISLFEQKEPPAIIGSGFVVCSGRCISVWIVAGLPPIENLLVSPRDI